MAEPSRSTSACLRCRKQKLRCSGPGQIPCQRCRTTRAECTFVAPRAARPLTLPAHAEGNDKVTLLEQRLDHVENQLRTEIQALQQTVAQLRPTNASSGLHSTLSVNSHRPSGRLITCQDNSSDNNDIVMCQLVTEDQWHKLHSFFHENCTSVIAFMDDQLYPDSEIAREHTLLSIVICLVASRAIMPEKYQSLLDQADEIVKGTFQGPAPDLLTTKALMLLVAWTGRARLWGYIASIATELKLNTAVFQLAESSVHQTEESIDQARTWLSLCCFDLAVNLNRSFVVNRMRDYLPYVDNLLASPYRRPVDHRIAAYIESFAIAADAKSQLQPTKLQIMPLPLDVTSLLDVSNEKIDRWFYDINNTINPLYQTFHGKQDRNRFLVPYSFLKIYINGFALYGVVLGNDPPDSKRREYLQNALDNAVLVIKTQYDSPTLRKGLRYTMDYSGVTSYYAINFIIKAMNAAHQYLDYAMVFPALHQAAEMFEQAGAIDAAVDIRREQDKLAMLTSTVLSPEVLEHGSSDNAANALFDIPSFWDEANWENPFPEMNV